MVKRVADFAKLGAKSKRSLPADLLANSDDTSDLLDAPDNVAGDDDDLVRTNSENGD
jgi:hypothetical protein